MSEQRYFLHGILTPSGALISELTDTSPQTSTELVTGYSSGHPSPLFRAIAAQKPQASFTCHAIAQVLGLFAAGGNVYSLDLSAGNTDLGYRQGQNLGERYAVASAYHERLRLSRALVVWDTIRATHQQTAEIACRLFAVYDGLNNPIVQVGTGALAGTPAAVQYYTLGPTYVNGVRLENEVDFNLTSGLQILQSGSAGEIWDRFAGIQQTDDKLTLNLHGKPWAAYGITGASIVTTVVQYLRAKQADGANVADGTPSHIRITASNGNIVPDNASGAQNNPVQNTLNLALRAADGASSVLAFSAVSTIP
jgi:hypothetical protein